MMILVKNNLGVVFTVEGGLVEEKYGRTVKFYDSGRLVSEYYIATLLDEKDRLVKNGLLLYASSSSWFIDGGEPMQKVMDFLERVKNYGKKD